MSYLSKLNQSQLQAVTAPLGPVLVLAGAGSGKTRVLTSRIVYLVKELGVNPSNVLAITFTNKAANEMKMRLANADCNAGLMRISTIHSFCAFILRNEAEHVDREKNFTIYDESDQLAVIKKVLKNVFVDDEDEHETSYWADVIAKCKGDTLAQSELEEKVVLAYNQRMRQNNAMDFDDLLFNVHKLFTFHPDVLEKYREQFKYILIDEFQDTNRVQYEIFSMLASQHKNIFVVGDDDQSIYSWRGAEVRNMFDFERDFSGAKVFMLEQNYRSSKKILEVANEIISKNAQRHEKTLFTENGAGVRVEVHSAFNEQEEAFYVLSQINSLLLRGYQFKDFAILMRINALTRSFEEAFNRTRIPYKVIGGFKFFERKEIKDVLSYLRIVDNPYDNEAFVRAIGFPKRGIGDTTIKKIEELAIENSISMVQLLSDERNLEVISAKTREKLLDFHSLYADLCEIARQRSVKEFVSSLISILELREYFTKNDEEERIYNLDELEQSVSEFERANPGARLSDYLQNVSLMADKEGEQNPNAVTISTIHGVKGLEYRAVFVVGLEEGIFPTNRATYSFEALQEERRLMYVAITRAKERLYLLRSQTRYLYGQRRQTMPSIYFSEVHKYLTPQIRPVFDENVLFDDRAYARLNRPTPPKQVIDKSHLKNYRVGQKVSHSAFGEGMILKIDGDVCDIVFECGKKRINVAICPVKIIN